MRENDNSRLLGTAVEFVGHKHFSIDLCKSFGASPQFLLHHIEVVVR